MRLCGPEGSLLPDTGHLLPSMSYCRKNYPRRNFLTSSLRTRLWSCSCHCEIAGRVYTVCWLP